MIILSEWNQSIIIYGGIIMNTTTETKVYTINGQIVSEAMYRAWLDERRGGSGFWWYEWKRIGGK